MTDLVFTVLMWGLSFALAKKALNEFTPFELVTLRLALGAMTAFFLTRFDTSTAKGVRGFSSWRPALALGIFEFAGTYILYTWALSYLPSGVVGALTLMTPVLTCLVGVFLGVEKFSPRVGVAVLISFLGAASCFPLGILFGNLSFSSPVALGVFLLMLSNLVFAVGNVLISKWENRREWSQVITARGLGIGACISAVVSASVHHHAVTDFSNWHIWLLPIYLGVIPTGLGFFLWNRGVQKVSATPASVIGNFKGPMALIWGAVLLHETVTLNLLIGLCLLFSAVMLLPRRKALKTT